MSQRHSPERTYKGQSSFTHNWTYKLVIKLLLNSFFSFLLLKIGASLIQYMSTTFPALHSTQLMFMGKKN